ncbi:dCTP pyrophosphatase 1-like isoform X1 [Crassostrea virginica]|uniref:dCTP pyrophosphatase 1 n=1 Tax=Crassostrea virginica TaxID=6565 RepID=A0A8B8EN14_CRAVI|nr:dCTP pyrophosphatase 1-like [Crassostrea virginica]
MNEDEQHEKDFKFSETPTLEQIREMQSVFCKERNWDQFHSPRNMLLALIGEVGELAEIFQWKGSINVGLPDFSEKEREHVSEELSDVLINLVRLADRCRLDLPSVVLRNIQHSPQRDSAPATTKTSKLFKPRPCNKE